ncbi:hypothetical protein Dcar01_00663 [Deinococcus carri]|uniref:DUF885 domain-containing protein n=1 Tax=Deinococcus carri TaxID=1211323 RepID=A0ABP9W3N3_9DEIO
MTPAPDPAERYIRLAHALDAHSEGFIDGYGGPQDWADRTRRDPAELRAEAQALLDEVSGVEDEARRAFLTVQVRAMHTLARRLAGETLPYADEVRGLYDIDPVRADTADLEAALGALDAALPGSGSLNEREEALRSRVVLLKDDILRVAQPILSTLRERTRERFGLPEGEDFSIGLVSDKPWTGYNWPLGNLRSRIDLNTDLPLLLPDLPDLLAHEGYPGHHTEHATKEARLVRERGWLEHGIQLINAPECVVSEGIAVNARAAVMSREELEAWLTGELVGMAGLDPDDVRAYLAASRAREGLKSVSGTAALMLHEDGAPEAEVLAFLRRYAVVSEDRARQSLRFISQPNFRAYIFTYSVGGDLVFQSSAPFDAVDPKGQTGGRKEAGMMTFARLLREPVTPGQLREAVPTA